MDQQYRSPETNNMLRQIILKINNSYLDKEKVFQMTFSGTTHTATALWDMAQQERKQGITRSLSVAGKSFRWSVSNEMESVLHELDVYVAGGKKFAQLIHQKNEHRYRVHAMVEESFFSARLSGINVQRKEARELLLKKRPAIDTPQHVVVNLFKTISEIHRLKENEITETDFLRIHQLLTKGTIMPKGVGKYRTNQKIDYTAIGIGENYQPVPVNRMQSGVEFLFVWINNDKNPFFIHPIIKAAIIHYLIIWLRPFKDGNGRMARLTAYWYLLKKGYAPLEYMSVSSVIFKFITQYHKSIATAENHENEMGYFIHFYIQSVRMAYKSLNESLQRTNREKELNRFHYIQTINNRQADILQWIKDDAQKIITIRELRSGFGISKETARTDLTALAEQGWLKVYALNKKTYAFVKGDLFDQLAQQYV